MNFEERDPGDRRRLRRRVLEERDALLRDRHRAVLLALDGRGAPEIASMLGRSRRSVQDWCYRYRDGGLDALLPKPRGRIKPKLPLEQHDAFKARMLAGPTDADEGRCTLRGLDAVRILEREFGVKYSLPGVYCLLHRLGLSSLKPRPRHRKSDPEQQERWLENAPLLSGRWRRSTPACPFRSGSKTSFAQVSRAR